MGASPHWQFISVDLASKSDFHMEPSVAQSQFALDFPLCGSLGVALLIQHPMQIAGIDCVVHLQSLTVNGA